jgi:hypothetical protein
MKQVKQQVQQVKTPYDSNVVADWTISLHAVRRTVGTVLS